MPGTFEILDCDSESGSGSDSDSDSESKCLEYARFLNYVYTLTVTHPQHTSLRVGVDI